jgi:hypothetical protein
MLQSILTPIWLPQEIQAVARSWHMKAAALMTRHALKPILAKVV